jgi:putative transposase
MLKAYKFRAEPTKEQLAVLIRTFGCVRYVWNYMLSLRRQEYFLEGMFPGRNVCSEELTRMKADKMHQWLNEVDAIALQTVLEYQLDSYQRFFRHQGGRPRYKSRKEHTDAYTTKRVGNNIRLDGNLLRLPRVGWVRLRLSRTVEGKIQRVTVSMNPARKIFVSILCEKSDGPTLPSGSGDVGIDVGISDLAVLDNGIKYPGPHALAKSLQRLKREQQSLSRKTRGSNRYEKQRLRVAKLHERVANIRRDYSHKLSMELVRTYDRIMAENLMIREMLGTSDETRARGIMDSGWREFLNMLEYKSAWYGRTFVRIGTYYPSSQLCSVCGYKNTMVKDTRIRNWTCPECGAVHDRDVNAAINIKKEGISLLTHSPR